MPKGTRNYEQRVRVELHAFGVHSPKGSQQRGSVDDGAGTEQKRQQKLHLYRVHCQYRPGRVLSLLEQCQQQGTEAGGGQMGGGRHANWNWPRNVPKGKNDQKLVGTVWLFIGPPSDHTMRVFLQEIGEKRD
uniref:Uncharacterized protein n=1 Tax=Globodera rostochiensis TaxID=31243 RepID=A0A914GQR0_GLORO